MRIAEEKCFEKQSEISRLETSYFNDELAVTRYLFANEKSIHSLVASHRDALVEMKEKILEGLSLHKNIGYVQTSKAFLSKLEALVTKVQTEIDVWKKHEGEFENLQNEIREYEHREVLAGQLSSVVTYVEKLVWIEKTSTIGGNTRKITRKFNELFTKLVT